MKIKIFASLIISTLLISSCRHSTKETIKDASPYFTNFYGKDNESVLHGIDMGMTAEDVKQKENAKLYESTEDHLFYTFSFPKDSTQFEEYADIHYFFNENNTLDIVTANVYVNDSIEENKLKSSLVQYFNNRYGKSEQDDYDNDVWHGSGNNKKTDKKYSYSVALAGLENDYGVSLEYMEE